MPHQAPSQTDINAPTQPSIRALFALLLQSLFQNGCTPGFKRLFGEAERLLADLLFRTAVKQSGRTDISAATHECFIVWGGHTLQFGIRARPGAINPYHRIILTRRRAARLAYIRRALARRSRFSRKRHKVYARANRRRAAQASSRHRARLRPTFHTPSRIAAPP